MKQRYRWRLRAPGSWIQLGVQVMEEGAQPLRVHLGLRRVPLSLRNAASIVWRFPLMTLQSLAAVYRNALRLWEKGADHHEHPRLEPEAR